MSKDLFHGFFPPDVLTFLSDRSIDFTPRAHHKGFTRQQKDYLQDRLGSFSIADVCQVHGNRVIHAVGIERTPEEADAIVTRKENLPLAVRTADCLPVFLYDEQHRAIGLVHAGWRGTQKRVVCQTLGLMRDLWQTDPGSVKVALGPAICKDHYEVGREFLDYFPDDVEIRGAKCYFDLKAVNKKQLMMSGIRGVNIFDSGICTYCDQNYFSYRREGKAAGRMIALMMLRGKGQ